MSFRRTALVSQEPSLAQEDTTEKRQLVVNANYEAFVFALSILQLANSFLWVFLRGQQEQLVVVAVSLGVSAFLVLDAIYRLWRSHWRRDYLFRYHGWLWWVGSLPIPFAILFRFLAYALTTRLLRRKDYAAMGDVVVQKRAQSALLLAILAGVVILELASILMLGAEEQSAQANIRSAGDAIWWAIVTMATVGYGDKFPVTALGRVIGVFVMFVGVGLFSVLTSFLAQWFVRTRQSAEQKPDASLAAPTDYQALVARLDTISALLEQQAAAQQSDATELRNHLAEIERYLKR